jgi:flagellar motor protein MotB
VKNFLGRPRLRRNSETWHVVYIDLMTNLMIVFVILWSIHQSKPVKLSTATGDTTSRMVNLPGDVIFSPGKMALTESGRTVFRKLFSQDETGQVLNFDNGGFSKRYLIIHGHTDGDGEKDDNLQLGFSRAFATYNVIRQYSKELPDHVILCTHADNSPLQELPVSALGMTPDQVEQIRAAKAKNRRITIEDKFDSQVQLE